MGYETRIVVVEEWGFEEFPKTGRELASVDLAKLNYDGPLATLIAQYTEKAIEGVEPPFALWAFNPDRQREAVEILREYSENATEPGGFPGSIEDKTTHANYLQKLSNDIEDGVVSKDKYGSWLGVIPIAEVITALEEDLKQDEYRRCQWALALLKSIRDSYTDTNRLKVITYGH